LKLAFLRAKSTILPMLCMLCCAIIASTHDFV
jgi:hypothetical protein